MLTSGHPDGVDCTCGHSRYVHKKDPRGHKTGSCNAYVCKRDARCDGFVEPLPLREPIAV